MSTKNIFKIPLIFISFVFLNGCAETDSSGSVNFGELVLKIQALSTHKNLSD